MMKKKIILVIFLIGIAIAMFFVIKTNYIKKILDMARNTKAWIEVKTSKEYASINRRKHAL